MTRVNKPNGLSNVMARTGATRGQMEHWRQFLAVRHDGTGRHVVFSETAIEQIACAVKVSRIWGGAAAVIALRTGALLPDGLSDEEWMAVYELRRARLGRTA